MSKKEEKTYEKIGGVGIKKKILFCEKNVDNDFKF